MPRIPNSIDSEKELPDWFSLDKYHGSRKLTAEEWLYQIKIRSDIQHLVETRIKDYGLKLPPTIVDILNKSLIEIRKKPIIDINDKSSSYLIHDGVMNEILSNELLHTMGIHDISLIQFEALKQHESKQKHEKINKYRGSMDLSSLNVWMKNTSYVSVDLSLPKKLLIKQFETYIDYKKKSLPEKEGSPISAMFEKWTGYGILPYFDLMIWEQIEQKNIPLEILEKKIYPNYLCKKNNICMHNECRGDKSICEHKRGNNKLATTTRSTAKKLFGYKDTPLLDILIADVAHEKSRVNHKKK